MERAGLADPQSNPLAGYMYTKVDSLYYLDRSFGAWRSLPPWAVQFMHYLNEAHLPVYADTALGILDRVRDEGYDIHIPIVLDEGSE